MFSFTSVFEFTDHHKTVLVQDSRACMNHGITYILYWSTTDVAHECQMQQDLVKLIQMSDALDLFATLELAIPSFQGKLNNLDSQHRPRLYPP